MNKVKITCGPGKYFLGDISLVLAKDAIDKWHHGFHRADGLVVCASRSGDTRSFAVCTISSENTEFWDGDNQKYLIRDSNIGLVPETMFNNQVDQKMLSGLGRMITAKKIIDFDVEDGVFLVTVDDSEIIEIDTLDEC